VKRPADFMVAILTMPLWIPVSAAVALAIAVIDGLPVFFRQERAGYGGKPFIMYKFRTMRTGEGPDAERITRLGRFLRRTSLDELPQLWNVIKGDMSFVGPRPLPTRYLPRYSEFQARRHEVRPGITGWAQVNGRNSLSWEDKFRYDVEYVDSRSLAMDAKVVAMTVWKVLRPSGISHEGEATMSEFTGSGEK
jgi:lipopolysaccharide/colanic/teichoic acid biosynthesis glycosyltransferase